ncbi:aminotransferase class I/II-fold pyridoxal phosphate-dependent enzyme [Fervidobacterium islandicum]|uniref:aminotransferase class I/II-fold pyridoxal phosphate-dependent enzyme n=1 Tax=Fervidobacterium islandicum TaxID=2423 RepID=UPI003A76448B
MANNTKRLRNFHGGIKDEHIVDFSISVNPFVPEFLLEALNHSLKNLKRYTYVEWIEEDFRKYFGKDAVVLAGATEAFQILAFTLMNNRTVLIPEPNYTEYERVARFGAKEIVKVNYILYGTIKLEILKKAIEKLTENFNKVVLITGNPNNPTGMYEDYSELLRWSLENYGSDVLFVLDEAFVDFVPEELRKSVGIEKYPNTIIVRSFTKVLGLPGVRVGYVRSIEFRDLFEKYRMPWGIGGDGFTILDALIKNIDSYFNFLKNTHSYFKKERQKFEQYMLFLSVTNFITIKVGNVENFIERFHKMKMHARRMYDFGMKDCVRIGLKDENSNDKLLEFLKEWKKEQQKE